VHGGDREGQRLGLTDNCRDVGSIGMTKVKRDYILRSTDLKTGQWRSWRLERLAVCRVCAWLIGAPCLLTSLGLLHGCGDDWSRLNHAYDALLQSDDFSARMETSAKFTQLETNSSEGEVVLESDWWRLAVPSSFGTPRVTIAGEQAAISFDDFALSIWKPLPGVIYDAKISKLSLFEDRVPRLARGSLEDIAAMFRDDPLTYLQTMMEQQPLTADEFAALPLERAQSVYAWTWAKLDRVGSAAGDWQIVATPKIVGLIHYRSDELGRRAAISLAARDQLFNCRLYIHRVSEGCDLRDVVEKIVGSFEPIAPGKLGELETVSVRSRGD
jgi:hypothetical protein